MFLFSDFSQFESKLLQSCTKMLRDQTLLSTDLYLSLIYLVSLKSKNLEVTIRYLSKKIDQNAFKQFCFDIHINDDVTDSHDHLQQVKQV